MNHIIKKTSPVIFGDISPDTGLALPPHELHWHARGLVLVEVDDGAGQDVVQLRAQGLREHRDLRRLLDVGALEQRHDVRPLARHRAVPDEGDDGERALLCYPEHTDNSYSGVTDGQ